MVASVFMSGFLENGANLRCGSYHVFMKFLLSLKVFCLQNAEMHKIHITSACKMRNCSKIQFRISCKMQNYSEIQFCISCKMQNCVKIQFCILCIMRNRTEFAYRIGKMRKLHEIKNSFKLKTLLLTYSRDFSLHLV